MPPFHISIEKDISVPMRDGTALATDVYWATGRPRGPVVLARLPYGKDSLSILSHPVMPDIFKLVGAGYTVVAQDCRGTWGSDGVFLPMFNEGRDGVDTLNWLVAQDFCDGQVGMFGGSYLGFTQWLALREGHEALKAIAPTVTTFDYFKAPWYHRGGAFELLGSLEWSLSMGIANLVKSSPDDDRMETLNTALYSPIRLAERLPYADQPLLNHTAPWFEEWISHPAYDDYWHSLSYPHSRARTDIPALHIAGWYDPFLTTVLDSYMHMTETRPIGQELIVGPWTHPDFSGRYGSVSFGPTADIQSQDITGRHIRFFGRWLDQIHDNERERPVRIFVMGSNEWRDEARWPPSEVRYANYYLDGQGHANTRGGDGLLAPLFPASDHVDAYAYDPATPVPTTGGATLGVTPACPPGPADQTRVETRSDVLCYTSQPLEEELEVVGSIRAVVFFSTTVVDTDVTARLVDVFPDGLAVNLSDGMLRTRYRASTQTPELMTPGTVYELHIDLGATANVFLRGHRIRLQIASSNFPRWDRNTNTGNIISRDPESAFIVARNSVHHGPTYPSRLTLPVNPI